MIKAPVLRLFQGYGVELEYMIVDRHSLNVLPVADQVLAAVAGEIVNEVRCGALRWSNELVLHVIELKTNGPAADFTGLAAEFQAQVCQINSRLAQLDAMLMPGAMHPWMNPDTETLLWPHGDRAIYQAYDKIFGCHGHGWSNLQSSHLNLPFADDGEFARLHAAVRLVLPLLPALAASSPVMNGQVNGRLDNRLDVYRLNQARVPQVAGQVIPEAAFSGAEYQRLILQPMYRAIAPQDPQQILQEEWLNSRGAIARFDRMAIEIRLLDVQECPAADLAIHQLIVAVVRELVNQSQVSWQQQSRWHENELAGVFLNVLNEGPDALIKDSTYLQMFGVDSAGLRVGELWSVLAQRLIPAASSLWPVLETILTQGPLARRLLGALGAQPNPDRLAAVYCDLCDCLHSGEMFHG